MNKRKVLGIASVIVLVVATIAVAVYVIGNVNEKPPVVVDQTTKPLSTEESTIAPVTPEKLYTANLNGVDNIHWGRGNLTVSDKNDQATLSFGDDFEVAQGPDLQVYLSPNPMGQELGEFATLGALKSNKGSQQYVLPDNYKDYKTIVIWCRAFGVTFATAEFDFVQ